MEKNPTQKWWKSPQEKEGKKTPNERKMGKMGGIAPKKKGYVHQVDHTAARLHAEPFGAQVFICSQKQNPPQKFIFEPQKRSPGIDVFVPGLKMNRFGVVSAQNLPLPPQGSRLAMMRLRIVCSSVTLISMSCRGDGAASHNSPHIL